MVHGLPDLPRSAGKNRARTTGITEFNVVDPVVLHMLFLCSPMRQPLPPTTMFLLCFGVYAFLMGMLATFSQVARIGTPTYGMVRQWSSALGCDILDPATPASWPGLAQTPFRPGDCVVDVLGTRSDLANDPVAAILQRPPEERFIRVTVQRGSETFSAMLEVTPLTLFNVLQLHLSYVLLRASMLIIGILVLLAQPRAELNRVMAALIFVVILVLTGKFDFADPIIPDFGRIYTMLSVVLGLAWIGPLMIHLAWLIPAPPRWRWFRPLISLPYLLAGLCTLLHEFSVATLSSGGWWVSPFAIVGLAGSGLLLIAGLLTFLIRMAVLMCTATESATRQRAQVLFWSWLLGLTPVILSYGIYQVTSLWPIPGTSLASFLPLMIFVITGTTFAMLRYQAFAYRGAVLNVLMVGLVSVALAQIVLLILPTRGTDGVEFGAIWLSTLATTLFWYVDNPFRRLFQRFFLRHQRDYEVAHRVASGIAPATNTEQTLSLAARTFRTELETGWTAIHCSAIPDRRWVADTHGVREEGRHLPLPGPPAWQTPLLDGDTPIGVVLIGARLSAEPLDERDHELIRLLAAYLSYALVRQIQIQRLEAIPGLLLCSEDRVRDQIARDLHDSVLPYFGALALSMDRARRLNERGASAELFQLLERYQNQATTVQRDLRTIIERARSVPRLDGHLPEAIRELARTLLDDTDIRLEWEADSARWPTVDGDSAAQLYRIAQQALTNSVQHAEARTVHVQLTEADGALRLLIADDGVGFDLNQQERTHHFGLLTMRERARSIGAVCMIDSSPGNGTRIEVRIEPPAGA